MSSATGLHKIVPEQGFIGRSFLHDEEARPILEAKKYRQYAKDCVRIAASMSGKDRQTLLDIADAWEACFALGLRLPPSRSALRRTQARRSSRSERRPGRGGRAD
jgi:hypothetical protein